MRYQILHGKEAKKTLWSKSSTSAKHQGWKWDTHQVVGKLWDKGVCTAHSRVWTSTSHSWFYLCLLHRDTGTLWKNLSLCDYSAGGKSDMPLNEHIFLVEKPVRACCLTSSAQGNRTFARKFNSKLSSCLAACKNLPGHWKHRENSI